MDIALKSLVSFEVTKENRVYQFVFPTNAPAGECHDVLYEFLAKVVKMSQENLKNMKPQADAEQTVEGK